MSTSQPFAFRSKVVVRARREWAAHGEASRLRLPVVHQLSNTAASLLPAPSQPDLCSSHEPTIRQCVRFRFEQAVAVAVDEFRSRRWKRRDGGEIIAILASDRFLTSPGADRVTIRELAARLHISSGRITDYEKMLREAVKRHLACDPQLPRLLDFAREDRSGMDGRLTPERREMLLREGQQALNSRLTSMAHQQRAELRYRLFRDSGAEPDDVVLDLHRLSICREMPASF